MHTRTRRRWIQVLPLVILLVACGSGEAARDVEEARLEAVLRLGELDGDAALTEILGVAEGPDGLLYVTQWQDPHVTVFGSDGTVVRRIGRAGSGPGEFVQAVFLGFLGDSLWVSGRDRLAVFEEDGSLVRHVAFRNGLEDPRLTYVPSHYMNGGALVATVGMPSSMIARGEITRVPILLTSPDGTRLDTLALSPVPRTMAEIQIEDYGMYTNLPELGGPGHVFGVDGSTLVLLDVSHDAPEGGVLNVTWLGPSGDTLGVQSDTFALEPFSSEVRRRIVDRLATQWSEFLPLTEARVREAADEQVPWPEFEPPYTSALVGSDQRVWLRREALSDSAVWEVWDPGHGPRLRVSAPADLELKYAADAHVWGVRKNSLDVPFLFRYTIVPID